MRGGAGYRHNDRSSAGKILHEVTCKLSCKLTTVYHYMSIQCYRDAPLGRANNCEAVKDSQLTWRQWQTQWPCMISFLETSEFFEAISEPPLASPCICSCVINTHPPSHDDHAWKMFRYSAPNRSLRTHYHLPSCEVWNFQESPDGTDIYTRSSLMQIWVFDEAHAQAPQGYQEFFQE